MTIILFCKLSYNFYLLVLFISIAIFIFFELLNITFYFKYNIILDWKESFFLNKPFTLINFIYFFKGFRFCLIFFFVSKILKIFLLIELLLFILFWSFKKLNFLNVKKFFLLIFNSNFILKFIFLNPLALVIIFDVLNFKHMIKKIFEIFNFPLLIDIPYLFLFKTSRWNCHCSYLITEYFLIFYKNKKIYKTKKEFIFDFLIFLENNFSSNIKTAKNLL